ncbi:MAG TPA: HNH endonuclease signature motif containing protein [Terriglobales bacterium]|nr:HNH endonuclease signature motif containing protein [Terriglobales bacterium]
MAPRGADLDVPTEQLAELVSATLTLRNQLDAALTGLVGRLDEQMRSEQGSNDPSVSCAAWLREEHHLNSSTAWGQVRLARQLRDLPRTSHRHPGDAAGRPRRPGRRAGLGLADQRRGPAPDRLRRRADPDPARRRALAQRDRRCVWERCDRPPDWCAGHHRHLWVEGGRTNVDEMNLLCRLHHGNYHRGYRLRRLPDGRVEEVPPEPRGPVFGPAIHAPPPAA